ncbi:MAG TPA: shikimate kinase [Candidatus Ozemobacteraceae bacterium]|nr:shikimate kinase [Candidatus Ozemobacteraceae bacterium]
MRKAIGLPIVLTGFMGAGKTTAGKLLAEALNRTFTDLDEHIEATTGKSVPEIFQESGETGFRTLESAVLNSLLAVRPSIILAAGGGTVIREENRARLCGQAITVFLDPPFDEIWRRIAGERGHRPLACGADREELERLHAERYSWYVNSAGIRIAKLATPEIIVRDIERALASFGGFS